MLSTTHGDPDSRHVGEVAVIAGTNTATSSELVLAAGQVIAQRITQGAAVIIDPAHADHAELSTMPPERTEAFTDASMVRVGRSGHMVAQAARHAITEMTIIADAAASMAACRNPVALAATQGGFAFAWFARAFSHSAALGAWAMLSYGAAMAPVSRAAPAA